MRLLILLVSVALASAKPGTYREKEDFEYSRSSSDDGSKSGYYGAQRGNMGGNYERAHNMDPLAQHQMSTLIRQVDGELGTGADTRTGSVFTAGSSRGVYGSGHYDLSNLKGRNFEEANAFGGSQSHSSMLSNSGSASSLGYGHEHASSNSRYSSSQSQSARQSSRFQSSGQSSSGVILGGQQAEDLHSSLQSEYDGQAANNYKYYGSNLRNSDYEENLRNVHGYNSNTQSRFVSGNPVKVYIRPGSTVTIPVSAQTYDATHFNSLHDQNSINSDAEVLGSSGQGLHFNPITKHYESSYKYKKEWEKHDTQTIVTPTENPFSHNSEFYDGAQISQGSKHEDNFGINHNSAQFNKLNSAYSNGYNAGSKSSSSHQSRYQSGLAAESQNLESSLASSQSKDILHEGLSGGNVVGDINSRPKHYHSSYSYHKAWERQGDPYVIEPVSSSGSNLQTSQRLSAASENFGHASSHQQGSHYSQSHRSYSSNGNSDCDENGHIRVARSYNTHQEPSVYQSHFEQQSQNDWANTEDLGQQTQDKWDSFTNLGQETQNKWDNLENLGQQTQDKWDNLENLGQQTQDKWDNLENLGQQTQDTWDHLENLSQQPQKQLENQDLGQKSQNIWENLEDLGQHPQSNLDKIEDMGQHVENKNDKQIEQKPKNTWDKLEDLEQKLNEQSDKHFHSQKEVQNKVENLGHQPQDVWGKLDDIEQQAQSGWDKHNLDQQTQSQWDHFFKERENYNNFGQGSQNQWHNLHNVMLNPQTQNWKNLQNINQQNLENGHVESHVNSQHEHLNSQEIENLFVQSNDRRHHLQEATSIPNTNYHTFWNSNAQENANYFKEFSNFWNRQEHSNMHYGQHEINSDSNHQTLKPINKEDTIQSLWDKIEKIDKNLQTQSKNDAYIHSVNNKISETTEQNSIAQKDSKHTITTNIDKVKDLNGSRTHNMVQPMDIGRGDIGPEDLTNELNSVEQHKNSNFLIDSTNHKTTEKIEYLNLKKHENEDSHDTTTNENLEDMSVLGLDQNIQSGNVHKMNSTLKEDSMVDSKTEVINHLDQPHMTTSNVHQISENFGQQNIDKQSKYFGQQNLDKQLEDFEQKNTDQQMEDFGQQNMDQQLEDFGQQNMNQQLEDFGQQNMDQQLEDFGQQNMNQQLENFGQQNTDQQLEDFGQRNMNQQFQDFGQQHMDQQLEGFEQQNMGQQFEDLGQMNQDLESQTLENFNHPPQLTQNIQNNKKLQKFGPTNEFEFNHPTHHNNNEELGQQEQKSWLPEKHVEQLSKVVEEPKGRSNELAVPEETVTEKPSFWSSVGNKFTSAKNTVTGWFKRS